MIKSIADEVWAFDCEWIPDVRAGRLLYHLPEALSDQEVLRVMWEQAGATAEQPQPFLKTVLCRVVSIATVIRRTAKNGDVHLFLHAIPDQPEAVEQCEEPLILRRFLLDGLAKNHPQLVGYNSRNADMRILLQRAFINGLDCREISDRVQAKPWESRDIDLMELVAGYGRGYSVALNEAATLCGIPGKLDTTGDDVCDLWHTGKRREIVQYNCCDALTTYLVWLRMAHVSGLMSLETYRLEERRLYQLIVRECEKPFGDYLQRYLTAWCALRQALGLPQLD